MAPTQFAPAERDSQETVRQQSDAFALIPFFREIFNAVPDTLVVLNDKRQIVFANNSLLELLGGTDMQSVCGLRVGDVLGCVHANETEGGCGTTEHCRMCGAVNAILTSQQGTQDVQECRITPDRKGEALDLKIHATPFEFSGKRYTVFSASDIRHEKRRKALERVFFSGVLGTARDLHGTAEDLLELDSVADLSTKTSNICDLSDKLVGEITAHRILAAAENNELRPRPARLSLFKLLEGVMDSFAGHPLSENRIIRIDDEAGDTEFVGERALHKLILGHMVQNALEATTKQGDVVTLGSGMGPRTVEIWVQNPGEMSHEAQLQVFQRSFTTKGEGRGLGTYLMRLLSERYLNGRVGFTSSATGGTTFRASFPRVLEV
ncbi:MAG: PAS domain-containing sensor histidine kinase [Candidatus Latescibacteria bacterium]|jgi:PAS domain-containing protein|nr:PAS domain-containing sensor histidine kinase [Candidatus Latescibacterota bacterium]